MMKGFIHICLLLLLTGSLCGQSERQPGAIYRDTVPLFIRADIFAKSTLQHGEFITITGKVKITIAQRQDYLLADAIIEQIPRKSKNLDSLQLQKIEYRICFANGFYTSWIALDNNKSLLDTFLSTDEKILIEFRPIGRSQIIQQTKIIRSSWQPVVSAFRTKIVSDTLNNKITAKSVYESIFLPNGFTPVHDSDLTIVPGRELELAVTRHDLNEDSCIEYKISDAAKKENAQWKKTGHLVTLTGLRAKHQYIIETRYRNQNKTKIYHVTVAPFLWQQTWAIVCIVFAALLLIGLVCYLVYKRQQKKKERQIEMGIDKCIKEQSKLDTHLVDNIFHGALGLIRNNQNELAQQYLGNASGFLRDKLIHAEKILVPFSDDMKSLEKFIANEQIKLGFRYSLYIDDELEIEKIMLPPLLWQPSLENSIKHGISDAADGNIEINVWKRRKDLLFTIRDNGRFIPKPIKTASGFGIPITMERITGLNMAYASQKIVYEVEHAENETVVSFIFKNWLV